MPEAVAAAVEQPPPVDAIETIFSRWIGDAGGRVQTVEFSPEYDGLLEHLAEATHVSKAEVLRRAIGFYTLAVEARQNGKWVGSVEADRELDTEFVVY